VSQFYQTSVQADTTRCDYVIEETVLAYSHDDIQNLGHTMSDFMNVWLMLWLSQQAAYAWYVNFLNIAAIWLAKKYHDVHTKFGL
jgi:hypothetical protein